MPDITVGGAPIISRRIGSTEVTKVMVGDVQIWPALKIVSYVSSLISIGATGAFPSHQAGDLLVVVAVGATAIPSLASGFTSAYTSSEGTMGVRVAYRFATASNTANGTWSGASWVSTYTFRNADTTTPFGAIDSIYTASSTLGRAPGLTLVNSKGQSVAVASFINNGTGTGPTTQPVGWIAKNRNARVISNEKIDTRSVEASSEQYSGAACNFRGTTFEVLPKASLIPVESGA